MNDIAVRPNASPLSANRNIVYIATDAGLTIMHEAANYGVVECRHYGYTGSSNAALTYKVLAGNTDTVTAVDYVYGHTAVYVATSDGAGNGALSVLRPYMQAGDTPFLLDSYRTDTAPAILSNNINAVDYGGSDALLGTDAGANRLTGSPTAVTLSDVAAVRKSSTPMWLAGAAVFLALLLFIGWAQRLLSGHRLAG